jgi:hypothetical protein
MNTTVTPIVAEVLAIHPRPIHEINHQAIAAWVATVGMQAVVTATNLNACITVAVRTVDMHASAVTRAVSKCTRYSVRFSSQQTPSNWTSGHWYSSSWFCRDKASVRKWS